MANNCEESPAQSWQRHTWDGLVSSCLLRFNRIWFYRLCWIFLLHQKHHLRAERYIMWIKKCLLWEKCVRCFASGRYHPAFKAFISRCSLKLKVFLFWAWKKWSLNVNTPTQIQKKKIQRTIRWSCGKWILGNSENLKAMSCHLTATLWRLQQQFRPDIGLCYSQNRWAS